MAKKTTKASPARPDVPPVEALARALVPVDMYGRVAGHNAETPGTRAKKGAKKSKAGTERPAVPDVLRVARQLVAVSLYGDVARGGDPLERKQRAQIAAHTIALLRAMSTPYPETVRNFRTAAQEQAQGNQATGQSFLKRVRALERRMKAS